MRSSMYRLTSILFIIAGGLSIAVAHAEEFPELEAAYSAEIHAVAGDMEMRGVVRIDGDKRRHELELNGASHISIVRADTGDIYTWEVGDDTALRMDFSNEAAGVMTREQIEALNPVFEARETVNGYDTLRFAVDGETLAGFPQKGHVWVTSDGIIVKSDVESKMGDEPFRAVTDFTNIERGRQDAALFELPEGLTVHQL